MRDRDQDKEPGWQGIAKESWRDRLDRLPGFTDGFDHYFRDLQDILRKWASPATFADNFVWSLRMLLEVGAGYSAASESGSLRTPTTPDDKDALRALKEVYATLKAYSDRRNQRRAIALRGRLLAGLTRIYRDKSLLVEERELLIRELWAEQGRLLFSDDVPKLALSKAEVSKNGGPATAAAKALGKVLKRSHAGLMRRQKRADKLGADGPVFHAPALTPRVIANVFVKVHGWLPRDAERAADFWTSLIEGTAVRTSDLHLDRGLVALSNQASPPSEDGQTEAPTGTSPQCPAKLPERAGRSRVRRRARGKP